VRTKGLRSAVWAGDAANPRDVGEALRDISDQVARRSAVDVIERERVLWAEPFSFEAEARPRLVMLADARLGGTLEAVDIGAIAWSAEGGRVQISSARTLRPGTVYDLRFLVVY